MWIVSTVIVVYTGVLLFGLLLGGALFVSSIPDDPKNRKK